MTDSLPGRCFCICIHGAPLPTDTIFTREFSSCCLGISHSKRVAQQEGTYFEGVSEVAGSKISLAREPVPIWEDPLSKLATLRTDLTIDRGMSFEVRGAACAGSSLYYIACEHDMWLHNVVNHWL